MPKERSCSPPIQIEITIFCFQSSLSLRGPNYLRNWRRAVDNRSNSSLMDNLGCFYKDMNNTLIPNLTSFYNLHPQLLPVPLSKCKNNFRQVVDSLLPPNYVYNPVYTFIRIFYLGIKGGTSKLRIILHPPG